MESNYLKDMPSYTEVFLGNNYFPYVESMNKNLGNNVNDRL